jgi:glutathione S-transferase
VPVLVDGEDVITDSPAILRHLEHRFPEPRLYPAEPCRSAEAEVFVAWFNGVWKRPPNLIADELARDSPDRVAIAEWGAQLTGSLPLFEALLDGRDYLLADAFGIADVIAFPFLKYATLWQDGDPDLFHRVLRDHLAVGGHGRLAAWIARVDALPRA